MIQSLCVVVFGACAYTPWKFSGTDPNLSVFLFMLQFQYSSRFFGSYVRNSPVRNLLRVPGRNTSFLREFELYVCAESSSGDERKTPLIPSRTSAIAILELNDPRATPKLCLSLNGAL